MEKETLFIQRYARLVTSNKMWPLLILALFSSFYGIGKSFQYWILGIPALQGENLTMSLAMLLVMMAGFALPCMLIELWQDVVRRATILEYLMAIGSICFLCTPSLVLLLVNICRSLCIWQLPLGDVLLGLILYSTAMMLLSFYVFRKLMKKADTLPTVALRRTTIVQVLLFLIFIGIGAVFAIPFATWNLMIVLLLLLAMYSMYSGYFALGEQLIDGFREKFIEWETTTYYGYKGKEETGARYRLFIGGEAIEKSVAAATEFGFHPSVVKTAIQKAEPIYTFAQGMKLDYECLWQFMRRLTYEDIPFWVEESHNGIWVKMEPAFYETIDAMPMLRKKKSDIEAEKQEKPDEDEELGILGKTLSTAVALIIVVIYPLWIMIFPIQMFRPLAWIDAQAKVKCYASYTCFDFRTAFHELFVVFVVLAFVYSPVLRSQYAAGIHIADITPFYGIGILFFLGECFLFPWYLKRMKASLEPEAYIGKSLEHTSIMRSRYDTYARRLYVCVILILFINCIRQGITKTMLLCAFPYLGAETAKCLILCVRYFQHRKDPFMQEDEDYAFIVKEDEEKAEDREAEEEVFAYAYAPLEIYHMDDEYVCCIEARSLHHTLFQQYADEDFDNGYGWEDILRTTLKEYPEILYALTIDSEAESCYIYAEKKADIAKFAQILCELLQDEAAFIACIKEVYAIENADVYA